MSSKNEVLLKIAQQARQKFAQVGHSQPMLDKFKESLQILQILPSLIATAPRCRN
jgi:hypothetical protein